VVRGPWPMSGSARSKPSSKSARTTSRNTQAAYPPPTNNMRSLLAQLEEAFRSGDQEGCWCRIIHPTKRMRDGTRLADIMKLVEIHEDGYYLFVACDQYFESMGAGGVLCFWLLKEEDVNIEWVRSGPNLVGSRLSGHELESDWFLNERVAT